MMRVEKDQEALGTTVIFNIPQPFRIRSGGFLCYSCTFPSTAFSLFIAYTQEHIAWDRTGSNCIKP